jgi:hypothetical protein
MIQTKNKKESFVTERKMGIHQLEQATGLNTVTKDDEKKRKKGSC